MYTRGVMDDERRILLGKREGWKGGRVDRGDVNGNIGTVSKNNEILETYLLLPVFHLDGYPKHRKKCFGFIFRGD